MLYEVITDLGRPARGRNHSARRDPWPYGGPEKLAQLGRQIRANSLQEEHAFRIAGAQVL